MSGDQDKHDEHFAKDATSDHERRIAALESVLPKAVLDTIYSDPHQWSDRPCPTCRMVTDLTGVAFGCVRYAKAKQQRK